MKKSAAISLVIFAALFLLTSCVATGGSSAKSAKDNTLKIGWAKRSIAMEGPVPITGQFYLRVSQGVFTPVEASALVLEDSGDAVIFVSCDVTGISKPLNERILRLLRKEMPSLPAEKIILNATHTHAGPSTSDVSVTYPVKVKITPSEKVISFLARQIADAVKEAWNKRSGGSIAYGYGFATTGHSRRTIYLKDMGKVFKTASGFTVNGYGKMFGDTSHDAFASYEAGTDPFINLLYTFDSKGKLTGAVINVPCPSQTNEQAWMLHASFWHNVREKLAAKYGKVGVICQSSAAGDLCPRQLHYKEAEKRRYMLKYREKIASYIKNPMKQPPMDGWKPDPVTPDSNEVVELMRAEDIANRIVAAFEEVLSWASREKFSSPGIRHEVRTLHLAKRSFPKAIVEVENRKHASSMKEKFLTGGDPWRMLKENSTLNSRRRRMGSIALRYEESRKDPFYTTKIHAVRIGNIAFASNRFELYLDYQHRIQGRSPFEQTFVVQLAADGAGTGTYLATERGERHKGYSATPYSNRVSHKGGQALVDATVKALYEVKKVRFTRNPSLVTVPKIKGVPGKADWAKAAVLKNFCLPDETAPVKFSAEIRLLQDGKNLYLKADCPAAQNCKSMMLAPEGLAKRDGGIWKYESLEFFLARGKEAYQFALGPTDCMMDGYIHPVKGNNFRWNAENLLWGAGASAHGWKGFITIALKDLTFASKGKENEYRFNVYRTHYYVDKNSMVRKVASCYLAPHGPFRNIARFGTLKLEK